MPQLTHGGSGAPSIWSDDTLLVNVHIEQIQSCVGLCFGGIRAAGRGVERPEVPADESDSELYLMEIFGLDFKKPAYCVR